MNKIQQCFEKEFPSNTDSIKFVDPTKNKIQKYWSATEAEQIKWADTPVFDYIEIPSELAFFIFRRGFDAACRSLIEEVHECQK